MHKKSKKQMLLGCRKIKHATPDSIHFIQTNFDNENL